MKPLGCIYSAVIVALWTLLISIVFLLTWGIAFPLFTIPMLASWSILRRHRDPIREGRIARLPDLIYPWVVLFLWTLVVLIGTVLLWIVIFWIAS